MKMFYFAFVSTFNLNFKACTVIQHHGIVTAWKEKCR